MKIGIIDVGGGTRGIYGAGVFDFFLDAEMKFCCVVGVSAGSANGITFLAGQHGRCRRFYTEYAFRKEYMSMGNFLRTGSYLDLDYIYGTLSRKDGEDPLDYPAAAADPTPFFAVATDAKTGLPRYFSKADMAQDNYLPMKASCCVPVVCRPYPAGSGLYYDGGISDPIPLRKAFAEGCDAVVIILTRPKDYFRTPGKDRLFSQLIRRNYPKAASAMQQRSAVYNGSLKEALALEKEGKAILIAPDDISGLKTLTKDKEQLEALYRKGYGDAKAALPRILAMQKGQP